jgi:hypothetical protein
MLLLNWLINSLPCEIHLPGYQFCGPGTRLHERLSSGQRGINRLDRLCLQHDLAYAQSTDLSHRHQADYKLREAALALSRDRTVGRLEWCGARFVALLMRIKLALSL